MKNPVSRITCILLSATLFSLPYPVMLAEAAAVEGTTDCSGMTMTFDEYEEFSGNTLQKPLILGDLSMGRYYLGDFLDANNTAVYKSLSVLTEPSVDVIKISLPEPVKFTCESQEIPDDVFYDAVFGACSSGFDALDHDKPEIFWLNQGGTSVGVKNLKYSYNPFTKLYSFTVSELQVTPAYSDSFDSMEEVLEYKQKLEDTVSAYNTEGDTRYDKIKNIHDQISGFTYYDLEGRFSGSALSALVEPGAVCEGYSKGFKLICDSIGIPCVCVFGNYNEGAASAHMWNYVRMEDGFWYAVDLTWDDCDGNYGIDVDYSFFLKGSDEFNIEHEPCEEYLLTKLKYPELAQWNYGERPYLTTETTSTATTVTETTTTTATTTTTTETTATTVTTMVTEIPEYEYGDLNRDGKVTTADLVYCASHVMGISQAEYSCDLNNDGRADVYDVILMRQLVVETIGYLKR